MLYRIPAETALGNQELLITALETSLPPMMGGSNPHITANVMAAISARKVLSWVWVDEVENGKVSALLFTTINSEPYAGINNLLVYGIHSWSAGRGSIARHWDMVYETLRAHAKEQGLHRIIAYTDVPRVKKVFEELGGNTDFSFCILEV